MYIIIILGFCIIIFSMILFRKLNSGHLKGKQGEKAVARVLKKLNGKLLNGVCLPLYDTITEIDHIFIGKMGIVVIETKNISGTVFGDVNDKNWTHNIGSKTHSLYNPLLQNKTHYDNICYHLRKFGLSQIPVYSVVVFSNDDVTYNITGKGNIIKIDKLFSYMNSLPKASYKMPINLIYKKLKTISQKNLLKLYNHNKNIKKLK